jgi:hypothetical protein
MIVFPDVTVEFSPFTDPFETPQWLDITVRLKSFSISRGGSRELDRVEAGLATFVFDNSLGQFDPTKTDGPYYPGIRPMRRIRIRTFSQSDVGTFYIGDSFVGGTDVLGGSSSAIDLFTGFVESWQQNWDPQPSPNPEATTTVRAVDAFKLLALSRGVPAVSGNSDSAVAEILDYMDWPVDERTIEAGSYQVAAAGGSLNVKLSALQEIDASEGGLFFVARDGTLTFYGADHVAANPPGAAQVWGDEADERQYQRLEFDYDESDIWNEVTMTSPNVADYVVIDPVSQDHYRVRPTTVPTVLNSTPEMATRAWDYLARFSTPRQRITGMEVGVRDDVEWNDILSKDLLDRIVVRRRPLPGQLIEQDSVIQGITITSGRLWDWSVVWRLSATPSVNLLTLNQSSLDTNTTGWVAVANCTVARSTSLMVYGAGIMTMTATGAGDMSASTTPNTQLAVVPGSVYSAMASFLKAGGGRDCHVELVWRDSGGSILSSSAGNVEDDGDVTVTSAVTAIAPASAAFATVLVVVSAAAGSEVHRVDVIGFFAGEQSGWSVGTG